VQLMKGHKKEEAIKDWGALSGGYEESFLLGYDVVLSVESQSTFQWRYLILALPDFNPEDDGEIFLIIVRWFQ
jgi:hypothetical protein